MRVFKLHLIEVGVRGMVSILLIGFITATATLYFVAYLKNPSTVGEAARNAFHLLFHPSQGFAYIIAAAFLLSSLLVIILPKELIAEWIGRGSGLKGITIATLAGMVTPGGPSLIYPILMALYRAGASIGPVIAYLSSWALMSLVRVTVWEIPFLGPSFAIVRLIVSILVPIALGLLGQWVYDSFFAPQSI